MATATGLTAEVQEDDRDAGGERLALGLPLGCEDHVSHHCHHLTPLKLVIRKGCVLGFCQNSITVSSCHDPCYLPCRHLTQQFWGSVLHMVTAAHPVPGGFKLLLVPPAMWPPSLLCSESPATHPCPSSLQPPAEMLLQTVILGHSEHTEGQALARVQIS